MQIATPQASVVDALIDQKLFLRTHPSVAKSNCYIYSHESGLAACPHDQRSVTHTLGEFNAWVKHLNLKLSV